MAISKNLPTRLHPLQHARNGTIPTAEWRKALVDAHNHVKRYQRRELFASSGQLVAIPAAGGTGARQRWRFRAPTGHGARAFILTGLMARTPATGTGPAYTEVTAVPVGGGTTITHKIYYGNVAAGVTVDDSLDELGEFTVTTAPCLENTTYEFSVADYQNARMAQLTVYEASAFEAIPPTVGEYIRSGYAAVGGAILDNQRAAILSSLTEMWNRNAAVLFQFAAELDNSAAPELAVATATNILDETSTTVSAATPGWEVDLQYKRSRASALVKAEFVAYARTTAGAGGSVSLRNSGGALTTITGISTGGAWYVKSVDLPATADKLDVHMATTTGTIRVLAAGLYLYA